jgi:GT2 family glycosyltransferase
MKGAAINPATRPLAQNPEEPPAWPPTLVVRALEAMRARRLEQAWLWADKLCRTSAGPARCDAYLLRSAIFALQGDRASAAADLRSAAEIDPDAPALNRALLASPHPHERLEAARRLLRAADMTDRNHGFAALAHMNVTCVGTIEFENGRLVGRLAWNGPEAVALLVRTDIDQRTVHVRPGLEPRPPGFKQAGRIDAALPEAAWVVAVTAPQLRFVLEPDSLLLPPPDSIPFSEGPQPAGNDPLIIVPAYKDRAATCACLESLFACLPGERSRCIAVVDDASPDAALSAMLDEFAASGRIKLLRNAINMGFAASVNRTLALRRKAQDVLLLNADTVVPPGAIEGLSRHVRDKADIGTVTPLSNNGEDTSFPRRFCPNPMLDAIEIAALQGIASQVNAGRAIDMPNGVGFCLYIRGKLFDDLGPLSHDYGRGYYEDVEFCLQAAKAGYRNVCATDVYVGHHGARSFAHGRRALVVRNLRRIGASYPTYLAQARTFEAVDPLKEAIGRIEEELLRQLPGRHLLLLPFDTPAFLSQALACALSAGPHNVIVARVGQSENGLDIAFFGADGVAPQNIVWRLAAGKKSRAEMTRRLSGWTIRSVTMLDVDALPRTLVDAVSELEVDVRLLVARPGVVRRAPSIGMKAVTRAVLESMKSPSGSQPVETITFPLLQSLGPPRLAKIGGGVAVVGAAGGKKEIALFRALAHALPVAEHRPSVFVAGSLPPDVVASLPNTVHVTGRIDDEELPAWLTRLGPRALLFADRNWGMADPRATAWAEAGVPIARFDRRTNKAREIGPCLLLPRDGSPAASAAAIAAWLSSAQP